MTRRLWVIIILGSLLIIGVLVLNHLVSNLPVSVDMGVIKLGPRPSGFATDSKVVDNKPDYKFDYSKFDNSLLKVVPKEGYERVNLIVKFYYDLKTHYGVSLPIDDHSEAFKDYVDSDRQGQLKYFVTNFTTSPSGDISYDGLKKLGLNLDWDPSPTIGGDIVSYKLLDQTHLEVYAETNYEGHLGPGAGECGNGTIIERMLFVKSGTQNEWLLDSVTTVENWPNDYEEATSTPPGHLCLDIDNEDKIVKYLNLKDSDSLTNNLEYTNDGLTLTFPKGLKIEPLYDGSIEVYDYAPMQVDDGCDMRGYVEGDMYVRPSTSQYKYIDFNLKRVDNDPRNALIEDHPSRSSSFDKDLDSGEIMEERVWHSGYSIYDTVEGCGNHVYYLALGASTTLKVSEPVTPPMSVDEDNQWLKIRDSASIFPYTRVFVDLVNNAKLAPPI